MNTIHRTFVPLQTLLTRILMLAIAEGAFAQQPATRAKASATADILIRDLEGADYGAGKTGGTAFGRISLTAQGGALSVDPLKVYEVTSTWKNK